ncbi:MAG: ADP-ribosylglycohydrolase family protein [Chloroflexota bacterium]
MDIKTTSGCLIGMALGDALGADTEFLNVAEILQRYPPKGPQALKGNPARVTDDTQMALAVGDALLAAPRPYSLDTLSAEFARTFMAWYDDPENNRAPGNTCLRACEELFEDKTWIEASQISSKGCGANMRVMPVGLLNVDAATRAGIAQLQAGITHGHPTGLAASDLTAFVIADLGNGGKASGLAQRVRDYAESRRSIYHEKWLGKLWERAFMLPTAQAYIEHGWSECMVVLDKLDAALLKMDRSTDPCLATGAGWIAEEAFATALFCFLMFPDDPVGVIQRAVVTSGDSDSIACIAGSFAGTYHGINAWPADWVERIEYHDHLMSMAQGLSEQKMEL